MLGKRELNFPGRTSENIHSTSFLKNSPILILDEITANLDYNNEKAINESLNKLKKGKITLMIAHRLSTIKMQIILFYTKWNLCRKWKI